MKYSKNEIDKMLCKREVLKLFDILVDAFSKGCYYDLYKLINDVFITKMNMYENENIYLPEYMSAVYTYKDLRLLLDINNMSTNKLDLRVCVCNPHNDLHNIGKNILTATMISLGFQVFECDSTYDAKEVVNFAIIQKANVIAISAMLLNTRSFIESVLMELRQKKCRQDVKVFIGGSGVDEEYSQCVKADFYSKNIVTTAKKMISCTKTRNEL